MFQFSNNTKGGSFRSSSHKLDKFEFSPLIFVYHGNETLIFLFTPTTVAIVVLLLKCKSTLFKLERIICVLYGARILVQKIHELEQDVLISFFSK